MTWQYTPYTVALLFGVAVAVGLAVYVWRHLRDSPGSVPLAAVQLGAACWSLGTALELASVERSAKIVWIQLQYLGIVTVAPMWLLFVLSHVGIRRGGRWLRPALAVVPVVTLALVATVDRHHLIYQATEMVSWQGRSMLAVHYGPWFWIHACYAYGLLLAGALLLLPVVWYSPHLYRGQIVSVLFGAAAPWLGNALYIFGLSPFPHLDLTPFGFIVMGATVIWGLYRFRLFDVVPVARHAVVEQLRDGVIVVGASGRLVDANSAAQALVGQPAGALIGQSPAAAFARAPQIIELLRERDPQLVAVLLTGWHLRPGDPRLAAFDVYLQKPFEVEQIRSTVQRALQAHGPQADAPETPPTPGPDPAPTGETPTG